MFPVPAIVAADLDADGKLDLAVTNTEGNNVKILVNGGFAEFSIAAVLSTFGERPVATAAGDLNGDGAIDLVTVDEASDELSFFLSQP